MEFLGRRIFQDDLFLCVQQIKRRKTEDFIQCLRIDLLGSVVGDGPILRHIGLHGLPITDILAGIDSQDREFSGFNLAIQRLVVAQSFDKGVAFVAFGVEEKEKRLCGR